jgi:hypothetical protein
MDVAELQRRLAEHECYAGAIDGAYGPLTRAAVLKALTDGPDYRLEDVDAAGAATSLGVEAAKVWALYEVESSGSAFIGGRPTILFEPHRFSRATGHRFDAAHPGVSYPNWDRSRYPRTQAARYDQLLTAVGLDVDAGFASASYGGFQILGENYALCDAPSPWSFAWRQSRSEADQVEALVSFIVRGGMRAALQACKPDDPASCEAFCRRYNGTGFRQNFYHVRFAAALGRRLG